MLQWLVIIPISNFLLNRQLWNFLTLKMIDRPSLSNSAYFFSAVKREHDAYVREDSTNAIW